MPLGERPGARPRRPPPRLLVRIARTLALAILAAGMFVLVLSAVTLSSSP